MSKKVTAVCLVIVGLFLLGVIGLLLGERWLSVLMLLAALGLLFGELDRTAARTTPRGPEDSHP